MPTVLEFFRAEEPRLKDVPDDELTQFIADSHPEFLQDPEFLDTASRHARSMQPVAPPPTPDRRATARTGAAASWAQVMEPQGQPAFDAAASAATAKRLGAEYQYRLGLSGQDQTKQALAKQMYTDGLRAAGIEPVSELQDPVTSAGHIIGPPVRKGGKVLGAAFADVQDAMAEAMVNEGNDPAARQVFAENPAPALQNLKAFADNPDAPLPQVEELNRLPAWARLPGKAAQGLVESLPAIGVAAAGGLAGLPAPVANVAAMGFDEQGNIDPVGVLAATGLPMVDKLGRGLASNAIQKTLARPIIISKPGELATKLAEHYPALQKESVQKALEIGGGQLADNAYLLALQTPGILQSENPKQALEDALMGNLALSILGAGELNKGRSLTAEQLSGKAARGEPIINLELKHPPAEPTTKDITPPAKKTESAQAGKPESEPYPELVPPPAPLPATTVLGRATSVRGSNDSQTPAQYAWVAASAIQASHGEHFAPNPAYAPLTNTRRYEADVAEQEKVLKGAADFEPFSYATNARGAAEGPIMVSTGNDGVLRVLGGNGRFQMIQRLTPENFAKLGEVMEEEAATFGLPPRPSPEHLLVRLLGPSDMSTPEGVAAAKLTVDLLNPSPGLIESTASMARNDAAKVPALMLAQVRPDSTPAQMRAWMGQLIADGALDRNTRTQIAANDGQLTDYVQRLLVQAAYHSDVVNEFRHDPKTAETGRALIDSGIPFLTELRARGETATSQAFTELVTRAADYQRQTPDRKLDDILQAIHAQAEGFETPAGTLARGVALALSGQVERLPVNKRGERKIDPEETAANFRTFFDALARTVKQAEAVPDLFGNRRTASQAIGEFIRAKVGDEPAVLREDSARGEGQPSIAKLRKQLFEGLGKNLNDFLRSAGRETLLEKYRLASQLFNAIGEEITLRRRLGENEKELFPLRYDIDHIAGALESELMIRGVEPVALQEPGGGYRAAPDPRVVALNKLEAARRERRLTRPEEQQRAALEMALGQHFMGFWNEHQGQQREAEQLTLLENGRTLAPYETGDAAAFEERRRKGKDPRQLEFEALTQADILGRVGPVPRPERDGGDVAGPAIGAARPAISVLAKVVRDDFVFQGGTSLIGKTIRNEADAAVAFQVVRNPQFEVFHWVLLKAGKVVGLYSSTARIPNTTYAWAKGDTQQTIRDLIQSTGADSYYVVHNHPSGNPDPSPSDVSATATNVRQVPGFLGHVVTNHTQYGFIDGNGNKSVRALPGVHPVQDPLRLPAAGQPLGDILGQVIEGGLGDFDERDSIAGFAARVAAHVNADVVSLLFADARHRIRALAHVSVADFADRPKFKRHLQETARAQGASEVHAYYTGARDITTVADDYVRNGTLWQALTPGNTPSDLRIASDGVFGRKLRQMERVRDKRWMGDAVSHDSASRIAEEGQREEFSTPAVTITFAKSPTLKGTTPLVMGGMQHVKPVEMPELVRLATELMGGQQVGLKKFRKSAGMFYSGPGGVAIKLDPRIFTNSADAAKVLAHEIGHLIDYLPTATLKRGNLVGRLHTLRSFLKDQFGPGAVSNKELRAELLALTKFWHPYDPATVPEHYKAYRESAVELYADALSVLMNSPGLLEQMAPKFYKEFWKAIDTKPNVKQALFDLQDLLNKGKIPVLEQRAADRETMFTKGDEILKRKAAEREARRKSWSGYWLELKQTLFDKFEPVIQKARQAEAAGATFPASADPRTMLDEGMMTDNANSRMVRRLFEQVIQPTEDAGITMAQLGDYLFLRRVHAGDRSPLANPLGTTPETARLDLLKMRLTLGHLHMTRLERAVERFHAIVFEAVEEAVRVGSYNTAAFKSTIEPNRDVYAAFAVLDYLEDYVPAGVKAQIGTLKEIANPFTATVLKTVALNNLNSIQRSKNVTRDLLRTNFPAEIEAAKGRFIAPGFTDRPPPKADKGIFSVLEDGRLAHYYVDPLIATAFERLDPQGLHRVVRVLDTVFRKGFYRLYITYSPSFLMFNPMRDFSRAWKNLPGAPLTGGRLRLARAYRDAFKSAVSHVRGLPDGLATEMMENYAIGVPSDTLVQGHRDDAFGDVMRRFHLLPEKDQPAFFQQWFVKPVLAIGRAMEFFGSVQEALPKMAAYTIAREKLGMAPRAAGAFVRNYAGTPNVFKKGTATQAVRAFIPFFNVFAQGWRADIQRMKLKSQSGWIFKWAMSDGFVAVFSGLAAAGVLGTMLKELFTGSSEYDKSNYNIIPVGTMPGGDFGKRVVYLRVPRDESSRLLSGLTYKLTRLGAEMVGFDKASKEWSDLLDFGAGQMPTVNPAIVIPEKWLEAATGHNPTDPFKGRPIIGLTELAAGGAAVLPAMFDWTIGQSGVGNFTKWDPQTTNTTEMVVSAIPGLKSLVKVSDYGFREAQQARENLIDKASAQQKLRLPDTARKLALEYSHLGSIELTNRTPAQIVRYETLNVWDNVVYREAAEKIKLAEQAGEKKAADAFRLQLEAQTKAFGVK